MRLEHGTWTMWAVLSTKRYLMADKQAGRGGWLRLSPGNGSQGVDCALVLMKLCTGRTSGLPSVSFCDPSRSLEEPGTAVDSLGAGGAMCDIAGMWLAAGLLTSERGVGGLRPPREDAGVRQTGASTTPATPCPCNGARPREAVVIVMSAVGGDVGGHLEGSDIAAAVSRQLRRLGLPGSALDFPKF